MLFLTALEQRIITVTIAQCWPIFYNIFFTYKLLKRSKNRTTLSLSSFFLVNMISLVLLLVSVFTVNTPSSYFFYIIGYYTFFFSCSFLIIFSWLVLKIDKVVSRKLVILFIFFYLISSCYIFLIGIGFNGIKYGPSTGWIPVFSLSLVIISWLYIIILFLIPEILISYKLLRVFQHSPIRKRFFLIFLSIIFEIFSLSLAILYNHWIDNVFYRTTFIFISIPLNTIAAYFMYRTLGKGLK